MDDEQIRRSSPRIDGGDGLTFDFPEARRKYASERRERHERRRQAGVFPPVSYFPAFHHIEERAYWKTALGTPQQHVDSTNLAGLGDFG
ncbi:hypothetical protein [Streptomyces sp. MS2.AVA.5]|uniref:Uncharacterized protein n=1 Tax=Streptomyces achmelvichensis TaxID=3134111 RepID=A0ACC6PKV4_9ACTN